MKKLLLAHLLVCTFLTAYTQDLFPNSENVLVNGYRSYADKTWVVDLDNDGKVDVVRLHYSSLIWHKNKGSIDFEEERLIIEQDEEIEAGSISFEDLDGDGDFDFVFPDNNASSLKWLKNDGAGNFSKEELNVGTIEDVKYTQIVDLNNDEKSDLLVITHELNNRRLLFFENLGFNQFSDRNYIIDTYGDTFSVLTADIDGDDKIDIIKYSADTSIYCFKNLGNTIFDTEKKIAAVSKSIAKVFIEDIDQDNDSDIICFQRDDDRVVWLEQLSDGTFSDEKVISNQLLTNLIDIEPVDIDGDNDLDIIAISEEPVISLFRFTEQGLYSGPHTISENATTSMGWGMESADVDNDGDMDLLTTGFFHGFSWYENLDSKENLNESFRLLKGNSFGLQSAAFVDIDADGFLDILTASKTANGLIWYRNLDGTGKFSNYHIIESPGCVAMCYGDLDGDSDLDIVTSSRYCGRYGCTGHISWYENLDGHGSFSKKKILLASQPSTDLHITDIDGDSDLDIVAISYNNSKIIWFENEYGKGIFNEAQILNTQLNNFSRLLPVDLDNDGDTDLIASSGSENKVVWYENEHGIGTFGQTQAIGDLIEADNLLHFDIDNDGDEDIICSSPKEGISWFENLDNASSFNLASDITLKGCSAIHLADIDNDGYVDLLSGSNGNLNWHGYDKHTHAFSPAQLIDSLSNLIQSIATGDVDNDGDLDVTAAASKPVFINAYIDKLSWYENKAIVSANYDAETITLSWYPVPTHTFLNIEADEVIERISLISIDGIEVLRQEIHKKTDQLEVAALHEGTYILKLFLKSGTEYSTLIIKE